MSANVYVYIFCWTKSTIKNDAENGQYAVKRRGYILTKIMSLTFHATFMGCIFGPNLLHVLKQPKSSISKVAKD